MGHAALSEIYQRIRAPSAFLTWSFDRVADPILDWRFGIKSSRRVSRTSLGFGSADFEGYQPFSYLDFGPVMRRVTIAPGDALVDFGCGKGRAVCLAAQYPFTRVIGVELSPELAQAARENIARVRGRLKCQEVHIVEANAPMFDVPNDAMVFLFFNPFRGSVMSQVLENIRRSVAEHNRCVLLLSYRSPCDLEFHEPFHAASWLRLREVVALPTGCQAAVWAAEPTF